ncbi:uncharacterized protein LOC112687284 [Sipha flava]|uniref:Uncharacterized protein LOC112687284 n=1 Tax=Sipha flava TaxID=143950 RepID=A0A8B8FZC5_9HEMI|nr:uncharacterized protein LOC112687284 [Sipha flava]
MFTVQAAASDYWDFGGTWSSDPAGVWFDMDVRNTVGIDKNIPVKISDRVMGTKSSGFMNKRWMAKANAKYGHLGPVSLFAINRLERSIAVFVGFVHSQNSKDFITGMWTIGRNCTNNLDIHQSVLNVPDVLRRDIT